MYSEVAWLIISLATPVQWQIILDSDYLQGHFFISYDHACINKLCCALQLFQNAHCC